MKLNRRNFLKAAAGTALLSSIGAQGFPVAGGSNLVCWRFDDGPHGYVREFTIAQASILPQLQQMYAAGQRRLAVVVPYFEGGDTFALDSSAGSLNAADRASLTGLLTTIRNIGFQHVMIRMLPEWSAYFGNWQNPTVMARYGVGLWRPRSYDRDYSFTADVWDATAQVFPDPYARGIDLCAEGILPDRSNYPSPDAFTQSLKFLQRFWDDWCYDYGVSGTVGYSIIPTQDRVANIAATYANGQQPYLWAVDCYPRDNSLWPAFKQGMTAAGLDRGYLITETFADDPTAARIFNADASIFWWYDWPVGPDTAWGVTQDRLCLGYLGPN